MRAARWLVSPLVAVVLLAGAILVVGQLLPGGNTVKIALSVAFFVAAGAVLGRLARARAPRLGVPFRAGVLLAGATLAGWYALSLRETEVQDELVAVPAERAPASGGGTSPAAQSTAQPPRETADAPRLLGRGRIRGIDHTASGTAEVVRMNGGAVVQLRRFSVEPGPDYHVYLARGETPDGGRRLAALKATKGNQRYEATVRDAQRFDTVLIWCRAFDVPVAAARVG